MSERKTSDAEIERVVSFFKFVSQEIDLRRDTNAWSEADLSYAVDRIDVHLSAYPREIRDQLRALYLRLLIERKEAEARDATERREAEARDILEAKNAKRHSEISQKLEDLKKPHWSIVPNFWMTVAILVLTFFGLIVAIIALRH